MVRLIARLFYACRGKRHVLLHLEDRPDITMPSIEGVLIGRWGGHYILLLPQLVNGADSKLALEGIVEVPAERVVFVQVLGGAA
jgi:hypothetical protein